MNRFTSGFFISGLRCRRFSYTVTSPIPEDLLPYIAGRGRQERKDSINVQILSERKQQAERIHSVEYDNDPQELAAILKKAGFGAKRRLKGFYEISHEDGYQKEITMTTGASNVNFVACCISY
jgi:hypothetical protein